MTLRNVGFSGGQAAAFTFDLARSIVYTRQGNPAWAGQERDGVTPIRPDDLFFGAKVGDVQPDWVDLNKVAIPQADEEQRLLVNMIVSMAQDKKPIPRFWYFPRGGKAVIVMTGDDHALGGTAGRFDAYKAASQAGCSVVNWQCIRSTSYIYPNSPLTAAQAAQYTTDGFEVALHAAPTGNLNCADWTPATIDTFFTSQLDAFTAKYPGAGPPATERMHCVVVGRLGHAAEGRVSHGIKLDTNYYYTPTRGWRRSRAS